MTKRRRLDPTADHYPPGPWEQQQLQSHPDPADPPFAAPHGVPTLRRSSTDLSTAANHAWQLPAPATHPHHYPPSLVASYPSQPYYSFHPSDPSAYNSPWPPPPPAPTPPSADAAAAAVVPPFIPHSTTTYSLPAPTAAMPYFPTHPSSRPTEETAFDALAVQTLQPDVDAAPSSTSASQHPSSQNGNPPNQLQRIDTASSSSAVYFEDASMHLKIQSLSILENLV